MDDHQKILEQQFQEFLKEYGNDFGGGRMDYFGINLSAEAVRKPELKLYYSRKYSEEADHPLIDFIRGQGMLRYVTRVQDTCGSGNEPPCDPKEILRFDVGLQNRSNENMEALFSWLSQHTVIFPRYRRELTQLARMRVTDRPGFDEAALYFAGFRAVRQQITLLKFHFFNRICEDPDILHRNITYADAYYLNYLRTSGISAFAALAPLLESVLTACGGHLWMTGADYAPEGPQKYKIYVKNPEQPYEGLIQVLTAQGQAIQGQAIQGHAIQRRAAEILAGRAAAVREWNLAHPAFVCEGFAVCRNADGSLSLNFYYRMQETG